MKAEDWDKAKKKAGRLVAKMSEDDRWAMRQALAEPDGLWYGDGGTIHSDRTLDVEVYEGRVVAVWFRCFMLDFKEHRIERRRADEMDTAYAKGHLGRLRGIEVLR